MINQFMLSKMLKDWNIEYEMLLIQAISVLRLIKANDYDLILMDTHMPGLNGYQAARTIRMDFAEPKRSVPIISLSAAVFEHEHQEAISAGMNDLLSKPYEPLPMLHKKIAEIVKQ
jgi:CheY-like chemotaxis protein